MTDIEQKALALVNEVRAEKGFGLISWFDREEDVDDIDREALCRAIEQHEAFRQEVSDAVEADINKQIQYGIEPKFRTHSVRFIIPKPDPLVETMLRAWPQYADRMDACRNDAEALRAAIEKRGGKIVWGEG